jgi:heme/copper-type cytochrome/quinol oxidase subunit 3
LAQAIATSHEAAQEATSTGLNHRKMLMWAFLGSDCMFFGALIATYLVYQGKSLTGPLPQDVFDILVTSVSTFVLLMSSMSMVLAYSALTRGKIKGFRIWVLATALLGMTFLGFQTFEFRDFAHHEVVVNCVNLDMSELTELEKGVAAGCSAGIDEVVESRGLTPRTNLFGSTFFTLTGFHGAHVTIGVIWLLSLFFFSYRRGGITARKSLDVDLAALYWHFVDVVWIVIFTVIYLFGVYEGF